MAARSGQFPRPTEARRHSNATDNRSPGCERRMETDMTLQYASSPVVSPVALAPRPNIGQPRILRVLIRSMNRRLACTPTRPAPLWS